MCIYFSIHTRTSSEWEKRRRVCRHRLLFFIVKIWKICTGKSAEIFFIRYQSHLILQPRNSSTFFVDFPLWDGVSERQGSLRLDLLGQCSIPRHFSRLELVMQLLSARAASLAEKTTIQCWNCRCSRGFSTLIWRLYVMEIAPGGCAYICSRIWATNPERVAYTTDYKTTTHPVLMRAVRIHLSFGKYSISLRQSFTILIFKKQNNGYFGNSALSALLEKRI